MLIGIICFPIGGTMIGKLPLQFHTWRSQPWRYRILIWDKEEELDYNLQTWILEYLINYLLTHWITLAKNAAIEGWFTVGSLAGLQHDHGNNEGNDQESKRETNGKHF